MGVVDTLDDCLCEQLRIDYIVNSLCGCGHGHGVGGMKKRRVVNNCFFKRKINIVQSQRYDNLKKIHVSDMYAYYENPHDESKNTKLA